MPIRKYSFTARVVNIRNSLQDYVVNVDSVNTLKSCLDKFWLNQPASSKMRICGLADFQTCKMRMVLQIFFADVTGKMRMWTQYYKLKKDKHLVEIFIVGITLRAIYVRYKTRSPAIAEGPRDAGVPVEIW